MREAETGGRSACQSITSTPKLTGSSGRRTRMPPRLGGTVGAVIMRTGTRGEAERGNCVVPIARKTGSFGVSSKLRKRRPHGGGALMGSRLRTGVEGWPPVRWQNPRSLREVREQDKPLGLGWEAEGQPGHMTG